MDLENEKNSDSFGAILHRVRKQKGLSLQEMSEKIGADKAGKPYLSPSYLHRLEKGDRDNPTIQIVGLLAEKLDLDLREILKCFGYEKLIDCEIYEKGDSIADIIRLSDIRIRADNKEKGDRYVSQSEKEILIKAMYCIFEYSTTDSNNLPMHISKMIDTMNQFRESSSQKSKVMVNIDGIDVSVVYEKNVSETLAELQWTIDDLLRVLRREINKHQLSKEGEYYIYETNWRVLIQCEMVGGMIQVSNMSRNINLARQT